MPSVPDTQKRVSLSYLDTHTGKPCFGCRSLFPIATIDVLAVALPHLAWSRIRVSQMCLGADVPSGLVPSTLFRPIFGHSFGLVYGEGGAPRTVPLHNLRVTSHVIH